MEKTTYLWGKVQAHFSDSVVVAVVEEQSLYIYQRGTCTLWHGGSVLGHGLSTLKTRNSLRCFGDLIVAFSVIL